MPDPRFDRAAPAGRQQHDHATNRQRQRQAARPTLAADKPTEILLAAAAQELFAGLSTADRAAAANVPTAVIQMQKLAADLRVKLSALDESIASVGAIGGNARRAEVVAQMQGERALVADRLQSAVEAMENLRLDLLKLRVLHHSKKIQERKKKGKKQGQQQVPLKKPAVMKKGINSQSTTSGISKVA